MNDTEPDSLNTTSGARAASMKNRLDYAYTSDSVRCRMRHYEYVYEPQCV